MIPLETKAAFGDLGTAIDAAFIYCDAGLTPIPAHFQTKIPKIIWKGITLEPSTFPKHFSPPCNVQIQLGKAFGGFVDIDLDTPAARRLAPLFLPATACRFGRKSSQSSHYIYRIDGTVKSKTFLTAASQSSKPLLEIRADGHLTVFPPSVHPSGELVRFEEGGDGLPTLVDGSDLSRCATHLAVATLISEIWPTESGCRQQLARALAGGLLRTLSSVEAGKIIASAAKAAGDEEADKRRAAVTDTASKMMSSSKVQGWPTVATLLGGKGKDLVATLCDWLADEATNLSQAKPNLICASDIVSKPVDWLWQGWLALGTLEILDGDPGQGKSTIAIDLAARLTTGKPFPDGSMCTIGNVLLIGCEDGFANTVKPRLLAAGADCDRVQIFDGITMGSAKKMPAFPDDLPALREAIVESQARLVIIDPLMAFLGSSINTYSDHSVRTALGPLAGLAEELNVVLLCIRHFSKQVGKSAIHKGGGSIGIVAAARLVMLVCKDPKDASLRVLAVAKSNLDQKPKALRYRIIGKHSDPGEPNAWQSSGIDWVGTCNLDADELVADSEQKPDSVLQKVQGFIQEALAAGPMKAKEVIELGTKKGHSSVTLQRASKALGVIKKAVFNGVTKESYWSLDEEGLATMQMANQPLSTPAIPSEILIS